jgi:hypothetical protein
MRVLFDIGTPRGLAQFLVGHAVEGARARGWSKLENGNLLSAAEAAGFDVLVTTDKKIRYQQNLAGRKIAIVVIEQIRRSLIKSFASEISAAVNAATPGSYTEVDIPLQTKNRH